MPWLYQLFHLYSFHFSSTSFKGKAFYISLGIFNKCDPTRKCFRKKYFPGFDKDLHSKLSHRLGKNTTISGLTVITGPGFAS